MAHTLHKTFTFLDWYLDTSRHELLLNYEIQTIGKVTEVLSFPPFSLNQANKKEIEAACDLVHWMCGVSYYKSGLAKEIKFKFKQPSELVLNFIKKTWFHGLAELAFENKISLRSCFKVAINGVRAFDLTRSCEPKSNALTRMLLS